VREGGVTMPVGEDDCGRDESTGGWMKNVHLLTRGKVNSMVVKYPLI
jgi:hypothetical protein